MIFFGASLALVCFILALLDWLPEMIGGCRVWKTLQRTRKAWGTGLHPPGAPNASWRVSAARKQDLDDAQNADSGIGNGIGEEKENIE